MLKTSEIDKSIRKNILNGIKIPHVTSYPVIHQENGNYYLAAFVFFFNRKDVETKTFNRPTLWAIANIENGKIIETRQTKDNDFSDAPYDKKYSITPSPEYDTSEQYYRDIFTMLDSIRKSIIKNNELHQDEYQSYLNLLLAKTPKNYRRFYEELSI